MSHLTKLPGVPSADQVRPGMAFYVYTGPDGKTCGDCRHNGYYDKDGVARDGCAMFRKLAGIHGPAIKGYYPACKYFE